MTKKVGQVKSWRRPSQVMKNSAPLLYGKLGKPVPNGVQQQAIGDCWFLASAAALAEKPSRITRLIHNRAYDENGIFRFRFWQKGQWHHVNVDDRLPYRKLWGWYVTSLGTMQSRNDAWWMPLMEKAYAKFDQNYERIQSGAGSEGIRVLSGAPVTVFKPDRLRMGAYWTLLRHLTANKFPMTAGCHRKAYGLITGHAYSVLDTAELRDEDGEVAHKLVQVRNPWSKEKYTGPFSDGSSAWTAAWKRQVGLKSQQDGKFWMPLNVFKYAYTQLSVGYTMDFAHTQKLSLNKMGHVWRYTFDNPVDQKLFITLDGYSTRNFPRTCPLGKRPLNPTILFRKGRRTLQRTNMGYYGSMSIGSLKGQTIPAGKYNIYMVNWDYRRAKMNVDVFVQTEKEKVDLSLECEKRYGWC